MTQEAAVDQTIETLVGQVMRQVAESRDVLLRGSAAEQSAVLAACAAACAPLYTVVSVAAPPTGLSLSALIAQLSGRRDFDGHDDSVLEAGFRRLASPVDGRRTVLLLDLAHGVQRPVLRYLQHVGRIAPSLTFVAGAGPELDAALAEPGVAALATRLAAAPPISVGSAVAPGVVTATPSPAAVAGPRRKGAWAVVAGGMAASLGIGFWLGHATDGPMRQTGRDFAMTAEPAVAAAPRLTAPAAPALAVPAAPSLAQPATAEATQPKQAALAAPVKAPEPTHFASLPEPAPLAKSEVQPAIAGGFDVAEPKAEAGTRLPPLVAHVAPARPTPPRAQAAAAQPRYRAPVNAEPPIPRWARWPDEREPEPYPGETRYAQSPDRAFIGSYVTGPYGNRVFQYDQR